MSGVAQIRGGSKTVFCNSDFNDTMIALLANSSQVFGSIFHEVCDDYFLHKSEDMQVRAHQATRGTAFAL